MMPTKQFTVVQPKFPDPVLSVSETKSESNITFYGGASEILKITEDGFYVRGKPVPADENEAAAVYRAFKQFLIHHALTRSV
jgi:hypothetical protein